MANLLFSCFLIFVLHAVLCLFSVLRNVRNA